MLSIFKDPKDYLRSSVVFFVMPACPASFFRERFPTAGMTDNYRNRVRHE
jgi:hypothetical protein